MERNRQNDRHRDTKTQRQRHRDTETNRETERQSISLTLKHEMRGRRDGRMERASERERERENRRQRRRESARGQGGERGLLYADADAGVDALANVGNDCVLARQPALHDSLRRGQEK